MIHLANLTLGHRGAAPLLEGATASFAAGTLTALVGRNGAGKSTLLRAVAGLSRPLAGEVRLGGRPVGSMTPGARARAVAFVSAGARQRVAACRCADAVALGRAPFTGWTGRLSASDRRAVADAIGSVGMEGYEGRLLESLSDGELQRIMIARALAQDTPAVLLDEPTSFLDVPGRRALASLLSRLARERGKCIVFSTHELDLARAYADTTALLAPPALICGAARSATIEAAVARAFSD